MLMNTISLKLPLSLLRQLEQAARLRRRSKSAVIRDCLAEALPGNGRKKGPSCHDLASHLAGSVRGPRDLSTRKDDYLNASVRKEYDRKTKRTR